MKSNRLFPGSYVSIFPFSKKQFEGASLAKGFGSRMVTEAEGYFCATSLLEVPLSDKKTNLMGLFCSMPYVAHEEVPLPVHRTVVGADLR